MVMYLALKGVGELHEKLAVHFLEAVLRRQHPIVAVADEHDRLPVQLVREQDLPADRSRLGRGAEGIQTGVAIGRHILRGSADKHARGERVGAPGSGYALDKELATHAKG